MRIALGLINLAGKFLDGSATEEDKRRVRDILPEKSASALAAEQIARGRR